MAGYKENFAGNVDYAYARGVRDITRSIENGMNRISANKGIFGQYREETRRVRGTIQELNKEMSFLKDEIEKTTDPKKVSRLTREFDRAKRAASEYGKQLKQIPFDAMEKGLKKVLEGMLSLNTSILTFAFDFLIDSIKRVYELQERWTKAIGGFNLKLGGMTAGLKQVTKAAISWSSTMRGLTNGDIEEGIQMFGDFTMAIGQVKTALNFQKWGIEVSRGFNLGGESAGRLALVMKNLGNSAEEATEFIGKDLVSSARAADVPINLLAKDIAESTTYMARFGKEGQKTFVGAAAYARKFGMSIKDLQKSVEGFDMFDDAAKGASKLNVAFGTVINSMDLMMEDDPAKRLEMIRQQFLAQGMTFDKLSPKQRRYFAETMKLSEDEAAAVLSRGEDYETFLKKREKAEKEDISAKKTMEMQLRKTAQTMYAFGMAFDRVTVAIANAIKPLLKVLGLAGKGDKDFTSFGQVMESVTTTVEEFFNSLAKNEKWNLFMRELAHDLVRAGKALKDFVVSGGAADLVGDIAEGMKSFYTWVRDAGIMIGKVLSPLIPIFLKLSQHIELAAAAWLTMKGISATNKFLSNTSSGLIGKGISALGSGSKAAGLGKLGIAGAAGGIGYALGGASAGIGAGVGSLVGNFIPFIGPVLGGAIGGLIGKAADWLFGKKKSAHEEKMDALNKELEEAQKAQVDQQSRFTAKLKEVGARRELAEAKIATSEAVMRDLSKKLADNHQKSVQVSGDDLNSLRERAMGLKLFAGNNKEAAEALKKLSDPSSGSVALTGKQLSALEAVSQKYNQELERLSKNTQFEIEEKLAASQGKARQTTIESAIAGFESQLKQTESYGKEFEDAIDGLEDIPDSIEQFNKLSGPEKELAKLQLKGFGKGTVGTDASIKAKLVELKREREIVEQRHDWEEKLKQKQLDLVATQMRDSKKLAEIQLRNALLSSDEFLQYKQKQINAGFTNEDAIYKGFINSQAAAGLIERDMWADLLNMRVPKLATGGIVKQPTIAMIGEKGPEAVVPLSKGNNVLGGQTVVIHNHIHLDGQKIGESKTVQRGMMNSVIRGRN